LYLAGMRGGNRVMWWNTIAIALIVAAWLITELSPYSLKPLLLQLLK
jgi:hypothetical protein